MDPKYKLVIVAGMGSCLSLVITTPVSFLFHPWSASMKNELWCCCRRLAACDVMYSARGGFTRSLLLCEFVSVFEASLMDGSAAISREERQPLDIGIL